MLCRGPALPGPRLFLLPLFTEGARTRVPRNSAAEQDDGSARKSSLCHVVTLPGASGLQDPSTIPFTRVRGSGVFRLCAEGVLHPQVPTPPLVLSRGEPPGPGSGRGGPPSPRRYPSKPAPPLRVPCCPSRSGPPRPPPPAVRS